MDFYICIQYLFRNDVKFARLCHIRTLCATPIAKFVYLRYSIQNHGFLAKILSIETDF